MAGAAVSVRSERLSRASELNWRNSDRPLQTEQLPAQADEANAQFAQAPHAVRTPARPRANVDPRQTVAPSPALMP